MLVLQLVVLAGLLEGCAALYCFDDFPIDNLQEFEYHLPKKPTSDYWNKLTQDRGPKTQMYNLHSAHYLFGKFDGDPSDATITVGYYKEDDSLINSIKVDCGEGTWTNYAPDDVDPTKPKQWQGGNLDDGSCVDGDIFDVILKTMQAHQMNFLYKGQALQYGSQVTNIEKNGKKKPRTRVLHIPSPDKRPKGGGMDATKLVAKTTGSAVLTRLAFGRCLAWPNEITENCTKVNEYLEARSHGKALSTGKGIHGANNFLFKMDCIQNGERYLWLQKAIHPNEHSKRVGSAMCCCVNMVTGRVFANRPEEHCGDCIDFTNDCSEAFDADLLPPDAFS